MTSGFLFNSVSISSFTKMDPKSTPSQMPDTPTYLPLRTRSRHIQLPARKETWAFQKSLSVLHLIVTEVERKVCWRWHLGFSFTLPTAALLYSSPEPHPPQNQPGCRPPTAFLGKHHHLRGKRVRGRMAPGWFIKYILINTCS